MNTVSGRTYTCFLGLGSVIPEALLLLSYAAMSGKLHVDDRPNTGLGVEQQAFYARY